MKATIHIFATKDYRGEPEIAVSTWDMSESSTGDFLLLETREIEVEIPDYRELTLLEVRHLERKAERVRNAAAAEVRNIEQRIEELRCLEYQGEEA